MFSKIFLSVLLLTCVYTYMHKSIKDNKDTNFQKLTDNLNFKLNGIQTVKPNLKMIEEKNFNIFLDVMFGTGFKKMAERYQYDFKSQTKIFDKETLSKLEESESLEEFEQIFNNNVLSKLQKDFDAEDYKKVTDFVDIWMDKRANTDIFKKYKEMIIRMIKDIVKD